MSRRVMGCGLGIVLAFVMVVALVGWALSVLEGTSPIKQLQPLFDPRVIVAGPLPAPLARAKGLYRYQILLRAPLTKQMTDPLRQVLAEFKWPADIECVVDVDALQMI